MKKYLYILFAALALTSCQFRDVEFIDFGAVSSQNKEWFQVTDSKITEYEDQCPDDCYMPDGTLANDFVEETEGASGLKATYTNMATFMSNLIAYGTKYTVREIAGTYQSVDADGKPIVLSGKVLLPVGKPVKRIILVSHYTICSDAEAPSNSFPLEGLLCADGYAMIFPDYIGYGITKNQIHPYLALKLTAINVIDMYRAVKPWLAAAGCAPEHDDIYLMGYSQGGANTMAVEWYIESNYSESIKIKRVFAGGGPYDVKTTYETFVKSEVASYPVAVPLVIQGMNIAEKCGVDMKVMLQPYIYDNLDNWINSKRYTSAQINKFIGTKNATQILTETGMDRTSKEVASLYKAMQVNSVVNLMWIPEAPVYILHSMNDETVPFINAQLAKDHWGYSNIQYNFGEYGKHTNTALRFIFSVKELLKDEAH